jgi:hypothetical protein
MLDINNFLNQNILSIIVVLIILVLVLTSVSIISFVEVKKLKKRYEVFTGGNKHAEYNLETQFANYHKTAKSIEEKYEKISEVVKDIDKNMEKCIQKVGVVRYNPFDEVGGKLSYAIALLDSKNNGVILNGIHSRSGSFTYAKPIELGVSEYALSYEENLALEEALTKSYSPEDRSGILETLEKTFVKDSINEKASEKIIEKEEENIPEDDEEIEAMLSEDEKTSSDDENSCAISEELKSILSAIDNKAAASAKN